jgi:hypothetical protein
MVRKSPDKVISLLCSMEYKTLTKVLYACRLLLEVSGAGGWVSPFNEIKPSRLAPLL